jgi:predicted dehydrogenase
VLVEKPMCTTVREAEAMVAAAERAGVLLMVAYMKRHEPAYHFAQARVRDMTDVRFIQVNHLHPDNSLHTSEFKVHRFDDIPRAAIEKSNADQAALLAEALGELPPTEGRVRAYNLILGSMIHDLGNLHGLFGPPKRVLSAEIWLDGRAVSTTLDYGADLRAVASWVDLPELWAFKETLEVYGSRERVLVSFPTGFSRGLPSYVTLHGMDADATPWRREYAWHDNPFKLELQHFGECIRTGKPPLTPGRDAIDDIKLVGEIVRTAG